MRNTYKEHDVLNIKLHKVQAFPLARKTSKRYYPLFIITVGYYCANVSIKTEIRDKGDKNKLRPI